MQNCVGFARTFGLVACLLQAARLEPEQMELLVAKLGIVHNAYKALNPDAAEEVNRQWLM